MFARLKVALFGLIGAAMSCGPPRASGTEVWFLSVGQGDCTVIRSAGKVVMVDAGPASDRFDAGARIILPKLRKMGITGVDLLLLTHPDADHIGGLSSIARRIKVHAIGTPIHFKGHPELVRELKEAGLIDLDIQWVSGPSEAKVGEAKLRMDIPRWDLETSDNEGSLFVHIQQGASSVMMTGDAGEVAELQMIKNGPWSAQVLKLGHHGSRFSSNDGWLDHVKPEFAVASAGKNNSYGHPALEVLDRCRNRGIVVWRTDQHGDLHLRATDRGFVRVQP